MPRDNRSKANAEVLERLLDDLERRGLAEGRAGGSARATLIRLLQRFAES